MATPAPTAGIAFDAEGRLAVDLPCSGCEYNLRTMREDAACPECGRSVAVSIVDFHRRNRNADWLYKVAHWAVMVSLASYTIIAVVVFAWVAIRLGVSEKVVAMIVISAMMFAVGLAIVAVVGVTEGDPRQRSPWFCVRNLPRWIAVACLALLSLVASFNHLAGEWLLFVVPLFPVAAYLALLYYMSTLARRANAPFLARVTLLVGAIHGLCVAAMELLSIYDLDRWLSPIFMATLITLIPAAPLFHVYYRVLRREAKRLLLIRPPTSARS